ncbi:MAG: zinc-dependent metalloprotease family protein [Flavobacteriales bacterium]
MNDIEQGAGGRRVGSRKWAWTVWAIAGSAAPIVWPWPALANTPPSAGGTVPLVHAAMVTNMNRVNAMFEQDATLTMVMVTNNDDLIYLNAGSDPYSNTNGSAMLGQNQTACDNVIGGANYDIGHVFNTG